MIYPAGEMPQKYGSASYASRQRPQLAMPGLRFYFSILTGPMRWLWQQARKGSCDDIVWAQGSCWAADIFENIGGLIKIDGLEHVASLNGPCVFIANHMSTFETFMLPGILRPFGPVTFVVKKSLTTMPVFGPIMRSRDPVVVERVNPRQDLATVLTEGAKRLNSGISVIVFPQHTRSPGFDAAQFNSIGVKLAARANAPVIPIALKTDAWGIGKKIKELGRIRPDLPARFKIGDPIAITGSGKDAQRQVCRFIEENIARWQALDGISV